MDGLKQKYQQQFSQLAIRGMSINGNVYLVPHYLFSSHFISIFVKNIANEKKKGKRNERISSTSKKQKINK